MQLGHLKRLEACLQSFVSGQRRSNRLTMGFDRIHVTHHAWSAQQNALMAWVNMEM
jgi:hypothetical protein